MSYQYTLVSSTTPSVVSKVFSFNDKGEVKKEVSAAIIDAACEVKQIDNLKQFGTLLTSLSQNQCLIYGLPPNGAQQIVLPEAWEKNKRPLNQTPRSQDLFTWNQNGGILMLDYDPPKDNSKGLTKEQILLAINRAIPELNNVQILYTPSTSSCLFHKDKELVGIKGMRFYILIDDATQIPKVGEWLNDRLWLYGIGRYEVSKSGTLLERPVFDSSVWQTNRIDFCAGAKCKSGITQNRGEPELIQEGKVSFDPNTLPSLTPEDKQKIETNKSKARSQKQDFSRATKEDWLHDRKREYRTKNPHINDAKLHILTSRALEQKELAGEWELEVQVASNKSELVSVGKILEDRNQYHGKLTKDPLEPDYDGGRWIGKLYLDNAYPNLFSFAHGGTNFRLVNKPAIVEIEDGHESEVIDNVLVVMRDTPTFFDFGDALVEVNDKNKLKPIKENSLRYLLGKVIQFQRDGKPKNPPPTVCKSILEMSRGLKPLEAVVTTPTLRPDGSVLDRKGYDETTGVLLLTNETLISVPQNPTEAQAKAALSLLMLPFKDFPFVSSLDKAVHLAAMLTVMIRSALPTAPGFAYDAPAKGSGKSLIASCIEVLATGEESSIWPAVDNRNADEVRKRAFTAIRSGAKTVQWDNLVDDFDSPALAGMMTSPRVSERQMSTQNILEVPNKSTMIFTGNNISFVGDMYRRVYACRIDPQIEKPHTRSFTLNPKKYCLDERQKMVSAGLTLIRFYLSSGVRVTSTGTASYDEWDRFVRQTILYLNQTIAIDELGDLNDVIDMSQAADPETENLAEFYQEWINQFGEEWLSASDLIDRIRGPLSSADFLAANKLTAILEQFAGLKWATPKTLGRKLKAKRDRVVGGLKLVCQNTNYGFVYSVAQKGNQS